MLKQYLQALPDEALERVVTKQMRPGAYTSTAEHGGPCLVGTAEKDSKDDWCFTISASMYVDDKNGKRIRSPERSYDGLCDRLGLDRANAAIRERAISILAARKGITAPELQEQPV